MNIPDPITTITGYRTWAVGFGQLWSAQGPELVRWPRIGPLHAACLKNGTATVIDPRITEHDAPDPLCTCGIYGVFAAWDIAVVKPRNPWILVAGRVEGWGRVAVGEKGFRAEIARPLHLFVETWWSERSRDAVTKVADAYRLPLLSWEASPASESASRLSEDSPTKPSTSRR